MKQYLEIFLFLFFLIHKHRLWFGFCFKQVSPWLMYVQLNRVVQNWLDYVSMVHELLMLCFWFSRVYTKIWCNINSFEHQHDCPLTKMYFCPFLEAPINCYRVLLIGVLLTSCALFACAFLIVNVEGKGSIDNKTILVSRIWKLMIKALFPASKFFLH